MRCSCLRFGFHKTRDCEVFAMTYGSSKAAITALVANPIVTVLKFIAALLTHPASMMNEAIQSMGSLNQRLLIGQQPTRPWSASR